MMDNGQLIPHLFRTEYRKIVSVLCKHFGFEQIEMAEDLASDTFLTAAQTWGVQGIPANPVAWLYNVAKNKARNHLQRHAVFDKKIAPEIRSTEAGFAEQDIDLSPQNINDSQLQMMFAICHPAIPAEAQIGLSLRILCGFGIEEIADAFLSNKETINKRLFRAREKLREEKISIDLPPAAAIDDRLATVLRTIYLLFNEGYYSLGPNHTLRKELCFEAMRLCTMLVEHPGTNKPAVNALLALMCFHASRFDARTNAAGELILYDEQDTDRWNTDLVSKGGYFLRCAAQGDTLSRYHLEAGIAYWNTHKQDSAEKWESILQLYNQLLQIEYSPVAALNRTYALSKVKGKPAAITEAEKLSLTRHHFYYILLGELYTGINNEKARQHFEQALLLTRTDAERQAIQKKLDCL
jgi:RNA polymerase sigma-70 factor (ECF subfamily)